MLSLILLTLYLLISVNADYTCPVKDAVSVSPDDQYHITKPFVDGSKSFFGGKIVDWIGPVEDVTSPIIDTSTGKRTIIGRIAQMGTPEAVAAVEAAKLAWNKGQGEWPQMTLEGRIAAIENVVQSLKERREEIINVLAWEICKTADDAKSEFDRTMAFIEATIAAFRSIDSKSTWNTISGIYARVRRAAIGIMLCLGPFNYPFNETYATLIPALLAGNIVIMKIPTLGGLAHILTMEAYAKHLPPGVLNFVAGAGRTTVGPMMRTGDIDIFAFIGGSKAADIVIKEHPHPHRLKTFLQLEGKNLGIVLPDADIATAVEQVVIGSLSYNGQRCTAIKLVMLHESIAEEFLRRLIAKVSSLKFGLPWQEGVQITPLAEGEKKIGYLQDLISDAVSKGATVINAEQGGGDLHGQLMRPAIVYPVTSDMRLWHEEQFGPVVPVAVFSDVQTVHDYVSAMPYGQQAAIFTSNAENAAPLVDALATVVGRVNINTQCGRSPDSLPFSGRRSSALGTMSITEAIDVFSIPVVVAAKSSDLNNGILKGLESSSNFLAPL